MLPRRIQRQRLLAAPIGGRTMAMFENHDFTSLVGKADANLTGTFTPRGHLVIELKRYGGLL